MKIFVPFLISFVLIQSAMADWKKTFWQCELKVTTITATLDKPATKFAQGSANDPQIFFENRSEAVHDIYWKLYVKSKDAELCRSKEFFEAFNHGDVPKAVGYWFARDEVKIHEMLRLRRWEHYQNKIGELMADEDLELSQYDVCNYVCDPYRLDPKRTDITFIPPQ